MTQRAEPTPEEQVRPGQLLDFVIRTSLDARYVLPDMDGRQAIAIIRRLPLEIGTLSQLTLVNASGACLAVSTRIIERAGIYSDAESTHPILEWQRPR